MTEKAAVTAVIRTICTRGMGIDHLRQDVPHGGVPVWERPRNLGRVPAAAPHVGDAATRSWPASQQADRVVTTETAERFDGPDGRPNLASFPTNRGDEDNHEIRLLLIRGSRQRRPNSIIE